jgi:membrane protease YdiL (CAAX protease family)
VSAGRLVRLAGGLTIWFYAILIPSMLVIDEPIATHLFSWMPNPLLQATGMEEAANTAGGGEVALLLLIAFLFNGNAGPITEELYFRGHLLPKLERYGRWAPVINTVLFAIYHLFSPWRYPAIILGFLPITWMAWRTRSIYVSIAAHMTINMLTILLLLAAALE